MMKRKFFKILNYCIHKGKNGGYIIILPYSYFFNVNDNEKIIFDAFQIRHCTLCYSNNLLILI
jgi:hypothetical protein